MPLSASTLYLPFSRLFRQILLYLNDIVLLLHRSEVNRYVIRLRYTNWWAEVEAVVVPVTSAAYSGQSRVVRESVVEVGAGPGQPVASHPSVAAASHRGIPEVVPCLEVVAASVLVDPAATAVCPSRVAESAWAAFDLVAAVDCYRPSTALTVECWAAWWNQAAVAVAASLPAVAACSPAAAIAYSCYSSLRLPGSMAVVPCPAAASSDRLASSAAVDAPEQPLTREVAAAWKEQTIIVPNLDIKKKNVVIMRRD